MFEGLLNYGYVGIAVFLILTGCGLPIPEEAAIIAAAVFAANGTLDPWLALLACLVGAVAGDTVMYLIGRNFGLALLEKHPLFCRLFGPEQEKKVERMLKSHGVKMILITRFLVGLRSPVYFAAGVLRVNYLRFLLTDILCATLVISLFFGLTYFYGKAIWSWIQNAELGITAAVVVGLVIAGVAFWLHRRGKAMLHLDEGEDAAAGNGESGTGERESADGVGHTDAAAAQTQQDKPAPATRPSANGVNGHAAQPDHKQHA